jgi:hypothetical protein
VIGVKQVDLRALLRRAKHVFAWMRYETRGRRF